MRLFYMNNEHYDYCAYKKRYNTYVIIEQASDMNNEHCDSLKQTIIMQMSL